MLILPYDQSDSIFFSKGEITFLWIITTTQHKSSGVDTEDGTTMFPIQDKVTEGALTKYQGI